MISKAGLIAPFEFGTTCGLATRGRARMDGMQRLAPSSTRWRWGSSRAIRAIKAARGRGQRSRILGVPAPNDCRICMLYEAGARRAKRTRIARGRLAAVHGDRLTARGRVPTGTAGAPATVPNKPSLGIGPVRLLPAIHPACSRRHSRWQRQDIRRPSPTATGPNGRVWARERAGVLLSMHWPGRPASARFMHSLPAPRS